MAKITVGFAKMRLDGSIWTAKRGHTLSSGRTTSEPNVGELCVRPSSTSLIDLYRTPDLLWIRVHRVCLNILKSLTKSGNLVVISPDGNRTLLGDGVGDPVSIRFNTFTCLPKIMLRPWYEVGAQYVDGGWGVEKGRLADLLAIVFRNGHRFEHTNRFGRILFKLRRAMFVRRQKFGVNRSIKNVELHYDLGEDLFASFLDSKLNYTCADFEGGASTVEEAQDTKLDNTLARLELKPGHKLLEIGCGWGALSRLAASKYGASVTALTLSKNQLKYSKRTAAELPPETPKLVYLLEDYRQHALSQAAIYDRIVSVGMLEHVGLQQLETYFAELKRLVKPNGVVLVHTIARRQAGVTNPWLAKNIFPGGYIAQTDEIIAAATENGFALSDRTYRYTASNYITTLREWAERFNRSWPVLQKNRYPERIRRTYNFYFAASEAAFRELDMNAVQFVFRPV